MSTQSSISTTDEGFQRELFLMEYSHLIESDNNEEDEEDDDEMDHQVQVEEEDEEEIEQINLEDDDEGDEEPSDEIEEVDLDDHNEPVPSTSASVNRLFDLDSEPPSSNESNSRNNNVEAGSSSSANSSIHRPDENSVGGRSRGTESNADNSGDSNGEDEDANDNENVNSNVLVSSQRSRVDHGDVDDRNINLSMFKTGELALVWYVGNDELSSLGKTKIKDVRRAITQAKLDVLCAAVKKIYPDLLLSASSGRKKNIGLVHIGLLVKGLAIIFYTQIQSCKKNITHSYEVLKHPAQIDLPTTEQPVGRKTRKSRQREESPVVDEATFGVFNHEATSATGALSPRAAGGGPALEFTPQPSNVEDRSHDDAVRPKRTKAGPRRPKEKRINELDIMSILEKRGSDLQNIGRENTLIGNANDLPQLGEVHPRDDFADSCPFQQMEEGVAVEMREAGQSSPTPSKQGGDVYPNAPRKRTRLATAPASPEKDPSSMVLNSLETDNLKAQASKKRRLMFNRIDNKTAFTLEELCRAQRPDPNLSQTRRNLDGVLIQPKPASYYFMGLNLISNCGRVIPSAHLKSMINGILPSGNKIRANEPQEPRNAADQTLQESLEENREEPLGVPEIESTVRSPPSRYVTGQENIIDADAMVPLQADSITDSRVTQENLEQTQVGPEISDRPKKLLTEIVGPDASRRKMAHVFGILLKMQSQHKVCLTQTEAYGPIAVQPLTKKTS